MGRARLPRVFPQASASAGSERWRDAVTFQAWAIYHGTARLRFLDAETIIKDGKVSDMREDQEGRVSAEVEGKGVRNSRLPDPPLPPPQQSRNKTEFTYSCSASSTLQLIKQLGRLLFPQ